MSGLQQKEAAGTEEVPHRNLLVDRSLEGLLDHRSIGWLSHGEIVVGEEEAAVENIAEDRAARSTTPSSEPSWAKKLKDKMKTLFCMQAKVQDSHGRQGESPP